MSHRPASKGGASNNCRSARRPFGPDASTPPDFTRWPEKPRSPIRITGGSMKEGIWEVLELLASPLKKDDEEQQANVNYSCPKKTKGYQYISIKRAVRTSLWLWSLMAAARLRSEGNPGQKTLLCVCQAVVYTPPPLHPSQPAILWPHEK